MRKNYHFQRILRQCRYLFRQIRNVTDDVLKLHLLGKLRLKMGQMPSFYQKSKMAVGLLAALSLVQVDGKAQVIEVSNYWWELDYMFASEGDGSIPPRLLYIDLDLDGDLDFIQTEITDAYYGGPEETLFYFGKNISNSQFPIFHVEVYDLDYLQDSTQLINHNFDKILLNDDPEIYSQGIIYLGLIDANGDGLLDLEVTTRPNYGSYYDLKIYPQYIENGLAKFDTIPTFEVDSLENRWKSVDINNDGNIDFIKASSNLRININIGDNTQPVFDLLHPQIVELPNVADFTGYFDYDKDGDLDLGFSDQKFNHEDQGDMYYDIFAGFIVNESIGNDIKFNPKPDTMAHMEFISSGYWQTALLVLEDIDQDKDMDVIYVFRERTFTLTPDYQAFLWIKNNLSKYKFVGEIKNENGTSLYSPLLIEPNPRVYWPKIDYDPVTYSVQYDFDVNLHNGLNKIYPRLEEGWVSSPEYIEVEAVEGVDSVVYQDFVIHCIDGKEDMSLEATTENVARPGFEHVQHVLVNNFTDSVQTNTLIWKPDERLTNLETYPDIDSIVDGAYYFTVESDPLQKWVLDCTVKVPTTVSIGDTLKSYYELLPKNDAQPSNNFVELKEVVVGSWDPNDKLVSPEGMGEQGLTDIENKEFTYTIRFQNTGNYNASNVLIIDTIDEQFDMRTFEVVGASPDYNHEYMNRHLFIENNVVRFALNNISLSPSSEDDLRSQGYLKYKIQLKEGAQPGTQLTNKADIYFDFNPPITTNETLNELAILTKVIEQELPKISSKIYPNPTKNKALIEWDKSSSAEMVLSVYSMNGTNLMSRKVSGGFTAIDVQDWGSGMYMYVLESPQGYAWGKFVVE
ncbi:MAG: T9SS type A sorting domain-containing protein [Chitinophagales bacterium]|nr:T9SS type A sorting domain-containing protein [Chitinophagales bacterium]